MSSKNHENYSTTMPRVFLKIFKVNHLQSVENVKTNTLWINDRRCKAKTWIAPEPQAHYSLKYLEAFLFFSRRTLGCSSAATMHQSGFSHPSCSAAMFLSRLSRALNSGVRPPGNLVNEKRRASLALIRRRVGDINKLLSYRRGGRVRFSQPFFFF